LLNLGNVFARIKISGRRRIGLKQEKIKIAIASDHAGLELKEQIKAFLEEVEYQYHDFGTHGSESTDYPIYGLKVAEAVASGEYDRGILICGTGVGMSIVANKMPGIRAAVCYDTETARIIREHNDTNVLCLGGRVTPAELAKKITEVWLKTPFSGEERHVRRIGQITAIEQKG